MKLSKIFFVIFIISVATLFTSCQTRDKKAEHESDIITAYQEGFDEGYDNGYADAGADLAYDNGYTKGYYEGRKDAADSAYDYLYEKYGIDDDFIIDYCNES